MEALKSLIKNIALFLLVGAIPSIGWASGYFTAFSWTTFFLLLGGWFCVLWFKERQNAQALKTILLTCKEGWALCEGDQLIIRSPFFPTSSLQTLKSFFHPDFSQEVEAAINGLIYKNVPFQIKVPTAQNVSVYTIKGEILEGKAIFWIKDITESTLLERMTKEHLEKTEAQLNQLQTTLDKLPLLIWHRDKDQELTYCNLAYSSAVGANFQMIQEQGVELIQPRAAKILARKAINTNEHQFLESTSVTDNRYFRICEIPNALEHRTLGVGFDITEVKEAQKEIKALMDAHNEVLAHLSTAIAIYDAAGTLQYYNQAYVNLYSFDEELLKTFPRLDEVLEDLRSRRQLPEYADFPAYKKKCLQQLTEQMEPREEMMHLPDERTLRNFSAPYPLGGILFMYEDVTNYLSLERDNKTLLNSYQITLDNLFEGVVVIGSNNRLELFNPSFLRLWDFKEEEVSIGQHLTLVVDKLKIFLEYGEDWEIYKAKFIESITDRVPKTGQLTRKDGVILNFGYVPLPNGSHLLSSVDATDTIQIKKALQESNEALETASRLKSELIENISSEIKFPLKSITDFMEAVRDKTLGELNKKQLTHIEGLLSSSTKILQLVNNILDLASLKAGHSTLNKRVVEVPKFLKNVIQIVSKKVKKERKSIILQCDPLVKTWVFDEHRIHQALLNLLSNLLNLRALNGNILIEVKIIENELVIFVTDGGGEFAATNQDPCFNKFECENDTIHTEAGVSLSLVKNFIELHGGRIKWYSEVNKGTTFICILPQISLQHLHNLNLPLLPCHPEPCVPIFAGPKDSG